MMRVLPFLFSLLLFAQPASAQPQIPENKNTVMVLGLIHSRHVESEKFSLPYLTNVIREINPDYVLTEIPPDRLAEAAAGFAKDGVVSEARTSRFPEYKDVLFPLLNEMNFKIIPTAGWTRPMAEFRSNALERISSDPARADDWAAYQEGTRSVRENIGDRSDDPLFIHTDEYDEIIKNGYQPYATLFADDLGRGDWERINAAHYELIHAALNHHAYEGKTLLITFGAGHKYWFLEQLRKRDDISLINPTPFLEKAKR